MGLEEQVDCSGQTEARENQEENQVHLVFNPKNLVMPWASNIPSGAKAPDRCCHLRHG
jgi:hypothetical protein